MRKFVAGIIVGIIIATASVSFASQPIRIMVNGIERKGDVEPVIIKNRAMVPVRLVAESFGAKVIWDKDARTVNIVASAPSTSKYTVEIENVKCENGQVTIEYAKNGDPTSIVVPSYNEETGKSYTPEELAQGFKEGWVAALHEWKTDASTNDFIFIGIDKLENLEIK